MTVRLSTLGKLGLGLLLSLAVSAEDLTTNGIVPIPNPPKAKEKFSAEQDCVAPIEIIRRNHGHFLKHQRDDTMHHGVRTKQHSLVACINCHVTQDETGNYPSIKEGSEHFCRSCHSYAAVSIDCFQCHASQPEK
jgi:acyl carrier protein phosphodiesterase